MRRIFVVGFPRSGTTLLQSLLGAHPEVTTFPESHLLSRALYGPWLSGRLALRKLPQWPLAREFLDACTLPRPIDESLLASIRRSDGRLLADPDELARNAIHLLDAVARRRDKQCWLEKTPDHLKVWRLLESAAPGAHFIHIARHPAEAIASYQQAAKRWPGAPTMVPAIALRWNRALARSLSCAGRRNHLLVSYETLVADPHGVARQLAERIGLSDEPNFSLAYQQVARSVILTHEEHKQRNLGEIRRSPASFASASQRRTIRLLARVELYERFRWRETVSG